MTDTPFAKMLAGGADYVQVHAARPDDPPFQRRTWKRANPSLDHFPALEARIRKEARLAKLDPSALASFKSLRLNGGCPDTVQALLLEAGTWERIEGEKQRTPGRISWALTWALTLPCLPLPRISWIRGALDTFAVFSPASEASGARACWTGVGRRYTAIWQTARTDTGPGQRSSDIAALLAEVVTRWGHPVAITCDRWREAELIEKLEAAKFPRCDLITRGMGWLDGGEDVRRFRESCLDGEGNAACIPADAIRNERGAGIS